MSSSSKPGVGHGGRDGLDGQGHRVDHQLAAEARHADAGHRHPVLELVGARPSAGPSGSGPAPRARRAARPGGSSDGLEQRQPDVLGLLEDRPAPACRRAPASGSQPTMFVVSRTRGSSSIATTATEYGTGKSADHCW